MSSRPSMKSILENARAMRTASLSGRKKTSTMCTSTTPPQNNSQSRSPMSLQSQSLVLDQSQYSSLQGGAYLHNRQPHQVGRGAHPPLLYSESNQFSNMSRASQLREVRSMREDIGQQVQSPGRPRTVNQLGKDIIGLMNAEMKKWGTTMEMTRIRERAQRQFSHLKLRKQFNIVCLLEEI